jgi:serine/threonine-protein kinase
MSGQLLDRRYQIIRVLGAGSFGQTYIAQDTRIPGNPTCVVKHLKPASSGPKYLETARRLFQSEAETLAKLGNHDQIPRLLAYFEENQEFYLVQEFIEGHPLSAELQPGQRWAETQVIQLLQEVLNILVFVHAQGVIHRDIKPDNMMRRALDHKLVLIDFGAIKQVRTQLVTAQGQVSATVAIGTPGYMPTEQGQGKPRPNSDIYALGMIGIQALTGLYPNQLQEDITTGEIIWRHQAQISPGLAEVLTKMTRYHFKDRYQSAAEALQAFQQLTNPYAPPAATPGCTPTDYATQYATNPGHTPPPQPSVPQPPLYSPPPTVPPQYRQELPNQSQPSQSDNISAPAQRPQLGWNFVYKWILADIVGMVVGVVVGLFVLLIAGIIVAIATDNTNSDALWEIVSSNRLSMSLAYAALGAVLGTAQWFVLRRQLPQAGGWVNATAVVNASYGALVAAQNGSFSSQSSGSTDPVLDMAMAVGYGALLGILQWWHCLRKQVPQSSWWILATTVSSVAFEVIELAGGEVASFVLGIIVDGAITGSMMLWLLRRKFSSSV